MESSRSEQSEERNNTIWNRVQSIRFRKHLLQQYSLSRNFKSNAMKHNFSYTKATSNDTSALHQESALYTEVYTQYVL